MRRRNSILHGTLRIIFCLAMVISSSTGSKFMFEKNSISVTSPDSVKGTYDSAIGNFGIPQYGGSMIGIAVYPKQNALACKNFTEFGISYKSSTGGGLPTILLVDRGNCYFALKVWNAQVAGASAVLVVDNKIEPLITMDTPEEEDVSSDYVQNITIPSALIQKSFGDKLKAAIAAGEMVNIKLDWSESLPHPDERVEYEFWTNSNDECGSKCDTQREFVKNFRGAAQILEQNGYTLFTPHYITWYCPQAYLTSKQCKSQCINHGRYCAPDPDKDFDKGYEGKDVVIENLRQLCVHKVATEINRPWVWWDYVTDFQIRCPMKEKKYNKECAEEIMKSLRVPVDKVQACMGNPDANSDNEILKKEQEAQLGKGARADVSFLPTLMINNVQYRGKLDKGAFLKAICAGFQETTEPAVCLQPEMETNECLENNGGCWQDKANNVTACKDTFRGRVCKCPVVNGVQYAGDGYNKCEAEGSSRCKINNGGCWQETRDGKHFSACQLTQSKGCECPAGFKGDGTKCEDIDECKERTACQCPDCHCNNTWGSYDCQCKKKGLLYIQEHDTCISALAAAGLGWGSIFIYGIVALGVVGGAGYFFYQSRMKPHMDSEIRAIMAQYMPLENQNDDVRIHM